MIEKFIITGDTHGSLQRFENLNYTEPNKIGIIILGDASFNFYLNKKDTKMKEYAKLLGYNFYCVRGNHEARPENIPNMKLIWDKEVLGPIYCEEEFPNIHYFLDGAEYKINDLRTLVIGGAYSVDKEYRLKRAGLSERENNPKATGWFSNEMLTEYEQDCIYNAYKNQNFDLILTHTCPVSWEPTDLFLPMIDQNKVNKSMENFLEKMRQCITFKYWFMGHYHDDRIIAPKVEMFYRDMEDLDYILYRWEKFDKEDTLDWWLKLDPKFEERNDKVNVHGF